MIDLAPDLYYIAIDGDDVGINLREKIISNDLHAASQFSDDLKTYFLKIRSLLEKLQHRIILCGGDDILTTCIAPPDISFFEALPVGPCTISIGIGLSAETAYLALQLAKARGKNQVVFLKAAIGETVHCW